MEEIKKWLDSEKNYDLGLILLGKYHKNRMLKTNLERRRVPEKLEYELRKVSGLQGYKGRLPSKLIKNIPVKEEKKEIKPSSIQLPEEVEITGLGKIKIIDPKSRKIDIKDLPEHLRVLYEKNVEIYRRQRSVHEKLKLMKGKKDADRKPLVNELIALDIELRVNWETIDNWDGTIPEKIENKQPPKIDHKRINANRKYITTQKKKLADVIASEDEEMIIEVKKKIQERVDELNYAGEELSDRSKDELKELGIKV